MFFFLHQHIDENTGCAYYPLPRCPGHHPDPGGAQSGTPTWRSISSGSSGKLYHLRSSGGRWNILATYLCLYLSGSIRIKIYAHSNQIDWIGIPIGMQDVSSTHAKGHL